MKKLLLSVASALAIFGTSAQTPYAVPNPGFENWSAAGKPTSWSGYGDIGLLIGAPAYTTITTAFQSSAIKNSGSYSVKLQNTTFAVLSGQTLPGFVWLGTAGTTSANKGVYGIPFTQGLTAFGAHARYDITNPTQGNKDTAVILCRTTKRTGTVQTTIDDASHPITSGTSGAFQTIAQPATNVTVGTPDTLWIVAYSSYYLATGSSTVSTSSLYLDDVTLTTPTGIKVPVLDLVDTRVAPNPTSDVLRFTTSQKNIGGFFRIYDALGKEVMKVQVVSALDNTFSVETLPNGIYFYQVSNAQGEVNAQGKFIVAKQ